MSREPFVDPNLARAPFENRRPVERFAGLLWLLAIVATGAAFWVSTSNRRDAGARERELAAATADASTARERAARFRAELESADLARRNERTAFLNERIAERAFSWNDLFDALGEVLPRGVRLIDLAPQGFTLDARVGAKNRATSPATTRVALRIRGEAEETEALLELVDRLYAHRAFDDPDLERESTGKDTRIDFLLNVGYLPGWLAAPPASGEAATAAAATATPGVALGNPASAAARGAAGSWTAAPPTAVAGGTPAPPGAGPAVAPGGAATQPADAPAPGAGVRVGSATVPGVSAARPARSAREVETAEELAERRRERTAAAGDTSEPDETLDPAARSARAGGEGPRQGATVGMTPPTVLPAPLKPFASAPAGMR